MKTKGDRFKAALDKAIEQKKFTLKKQDDTSMAIHGRGRWPQHYLVLIQELERPDGTKRWAYNGVLIGGVDLSIHAHVTMDTAIKMLDLKLED